MHGPTFMGNALACAAANASLDLFEREPRLEQARAIGALLAERLEPAREMPGIADVRVKGALGVIEVETMLDLDWLTQRFIDEGLWLRPFANVIYTKIGRAHVCTPVTNAHLVCRLLLEKKKPHTHNH